MTVISNGTNLINNGAVDSAVPVGKMTLIKTLTASNSANLSFVHGASGVVLDGTYDTYVFKFINCHPVTDNHYFLVNFRDGGSAYDALKATTFFRARHNEGDGGDALEYVGGDDLSNTSDYQRIGNGVGNDNDESICGELTLISPSSTTFVKHFMVTTSMSEATPAHNQTFVAGYCNTTTAIDGVQFKFGSGNFDGVIKLYGIGG